MKLNKTLMMAALIAGSLFAGGFAAQAQSDTNTPPAGTPPGVIRGRPNLDMLAKHLELTDDQKPKVQAVVEDMAQKIRALRTDDSVAQADKRAKRKEIRDAATAQLKDILTAEQFAKWEKMTSGPRQHPQSSAPADAATPPPTPKN